MNFNRARAELEQERNTRYHNQSTTSFFTNVNKTPRRANDETIQTDIDQHDNSTIERNDAQNFDSSVEPARQLAKTPSQAVFTDYDITDEIGNNQQNSIIHQLEFRDMSKIDDAKMVTEPRKKHIGMSSKTNKTITTGKIDPISEPRIKQGKINQTITPARIDPSNMTSAVDQSQRNANLSPNNEMVSNMTSVVNQNKRNANLSPNNEMVSNMTPAANQNKRNANLSPNNEIISNMTPAANQNKRNANFSPNNEMVSNMTSAANQSKRNANLSPNEMISGGFLSSATAEKKNPSRGV